MKRLWLGLSALLLLAQPCLAQSTVTWPAFVAALSASGALAGTELISGVQSAAGVKITPAQILTYVLANGAATGTITSSSTAQCAVFSASTTIAGTANCTVTAGALTLGVSGTLGSVTMGNATSGTVKIQPVTGALGTVTASLPANTGTIAETNLAQSFSATQGFNSAVPQIIVGQTAVANGEIDFNGSTSGTTALVSNVAAGGTVTLPAANTTLAGLAIKQEFTAQQNFSPIATVTDASPIAWNLTTAQVGLVTIASTGETLTPSNVVSGGTYLLYIVQGSGGNKTITTYTNIQFPGGTHPTLSTSAGAVDLLSCSSKDGTTLQCVFSGNFS